jgi:hypothetical protein
LVPYSINPSNNNGIYTLTGNITVGNNIISNSGFIAGAGGNKPVVISVSSQPAAMC